MKAATMQARVLTVLLDLVERQEPVPENLHLGAMAGYGDVIAVMRALKGLRAAGRIAMEYRGAGTAQQRRVRVDGGPWTPWPTTARPRVGPVEVWMQDVSMAAAQPDPDGPRDVDAEARRLIEAAVAAGRVTRLPPRYATGSVVTRGGLSGVVAHL